MATILRRFGLTVIPSLTRQNLLAPCTPVIGSSSLRLINYTATVMPDLEEQGSEREKVRKWLTYNDKLYPPTRPDETPRPAYVCHIKENIKYSPKKMWYVACFVRGMSVDEALKQLEFVNRKGALIVKEAILEAQQLAMEKHNVEFKSNLWVAESFVSKGVTVKGMRRHARMRAGIIEYKYCHYYIRLEEGKPPANYYNRPSRDKETLLNDWLQRMRYRRIINSL
uniref:Large ribosomal subunit protein uL22m n=1 Tax=Lygus hesperus TaxID=30085 RepID=A0A0A9WHH0_LYGHE